MAASEVLHVLTVNAGSTSLKLERYALTGDPGDPATAPLASDVRSPESADAGKALADALRDDVTLVAHRFVRVPDGSPPAFVLDTAARERIAAAGADAPLHDARALGYVDIVGLLRPDVRQVAVSDSAFHTTMPAAATTYALPRALTERGLRRIGFHGLSHAYAAARGAAIAGVPLRQSRIVTAHLGGGSSLCAVRSGESVDTTMGYTPLEGVPMATRSGSVDPGLLLHLLREGMTAADLEDMLEHRSGLLGISGRSGDVRELLAARDDANARLALDVLAWRVRAAFGAMIATLGAADCLVFTGGIGEHAAELRAAVIEGGLGSGVRLDPARNAAAVEGRIDAVGSAVAVCIVTAREGWMLARAAAQLTRS